MVGQKGLRSTWMGLSKLHGLLTHDSCQEIHALEHEHDALHTIMGAIDHAYIF